MSASLLEEIRDLLTVAVDELRQLRRAVATNEKMFLSAAGAGKVLHLDRAKVSKLCAAGVIRAERDGRGWRIPRSEIERLEKTGVPAEPARRGRPRTKKAPASPGAGIRKIEV